MARSAGDFVILTLASADPIGGAIITDWYNDPGQDNERVKLNIIISGLELRADAVRVSMFREKQIWVDGPASPLQHRLHARWKTSS